MRGYSKGQTRRECGAKLLVQSFKNISCLDISILDYNENIIHYKKRRVIGEDRQEMGEKLKFIKSKIMHKDLVGQQCMKFGDSEFSLVPHLHMF